MKFGDAERRILSYFSKGTEIIFKGNKLKVEESGKPTTPKGEPKTDIYIAATSDKEVEEIKISYKKENADFLENKTNSIRAEQLFGSEWRTIIEKSTLSIKEKFEERARIYKKALSKTEEGAITLGWKFELLNKPSGDLSGKIELTKQQLYDVYAGTNMSEEKRNATVNGRVIKNSGVADYILVTDEVESAQEVLDKMVSIEEYIGKHPDIYFACKALNYRSYKDKYDGNRPLAVQVDWYVEDGKLKSKLVYNTPLENNGNNVANKLVACLKDLGIKTTKDINSSNAETKNIYE